MPTLPAAIIISALALFFTVLSSVVVVVWQFATVAKKLDSLGDKVGELTGELREHREVIQESAVQLATLTQRVSALEVTGGPLRRGRA